MFSLLWEEAQWLQTTIERIKIKTFHLLNQSRKLACVIWSVANAGSELYSAHCWKLVSVYIYNRLCDGHSGHSAYKHYPVAKTQFSWISINWGYYEFDFSCSSVHFKSVWKARIMAACHNYLCIWLWRLKLMVRQSHICMRCLCITKCSVW